MAEDPKLEEDVPQIKPISEVKIDLLPGESEPEPEENRVVDLAEHVTSVYGIPYARAREMMAVGQIFIDGELAHGDQIFFFNEEEINGKTIEIKAPVQSVRFDYSAEERNSF